MSENAAVSEEVAVPQPVPTERIPAYDYAVEHGKFSESHYLALGNLIMNHSPCDVLIIGAELDDAYYHLCNAKKNKGTGRTVILEHRPEKLAAIKQVLPEDPRCQIVGMNYADEIEGEGGRIDLEIKVLNAINTIKWEVILVNAPGDKSKLAQALKLARSLRTANNWIFVTNFHVDALRPVIKEILGEPKGIIKGFRLNAHATWAQYGGRHRHPITGEYFK